MTDKKKRGRPPLDATDPSISVHFRLPTKQYDATAANARASRLELAEWIRRALRIANTKPPPWT
jgi:hypothetical protein